MSRGLGDVYKRQIKALAKSGADALLIGTVLMEAPKPEELISEFKEVYNAERK